MNVHTLGILVAIFFVLDLFFVALRASFIYARIPHLGNLREKNPEAVERTLKFLERPHLTATLRIFVVFCHFLLAGSIALLFMQLFLASNNLWIPLLLLLVVVIILQIIEFGLEGRVLRNVESWAINLTGMGKFVDFLIRPISALLMVALGKPEALQRSLGSVTDDELRNWVETGQTEGTLEQDERKMIYSIFQLGDTLSREIMVPRIDVAALDANTPLEEAIQVVRESGHSRMPVYNEVIDNIIGLLYAKDLLGAVTSDPARRPGTIRNLVRPAYFIPEAKKADELLSEMLSRRVHMAIVIDEYGGMAGLVTLEDIVEEIVGEIRDEYDQGEELPYQKVNDHEYIFQARIDLDDFNDITGAHLTKEVADTLGGWLYGEIGRVPTGGEQVMVDGWQLTVEQISGRRIRKVHASKEPVKPESEENHED
jgi:CBS domain containing-hemolysin-like protein